MASSQMEYILQNMQKELEAQVEKVTKCRNEKGLLRSYKECKWAVKMAHFGGKVRTRHLSGHWDPLETVDAVYHV